MPMSLGQRIGSKQQLLGLNPDILAGKTATKPSIAKTNQISDSCNNLSDYFYKVNKISQEREIYEQSNLFLDVNELC